MENCCLPAQATVCSTGIFASHGANMIEKLRSYLLMLSFIVIMGGLMLYMYVLASGDGGSLFGDGEGTLQPTNFETLAYNIGDNGYLLCDADLCANASADGSAEIFTISASQLVQLVADHSDVTPTVDTHNFDFRKNQFDFLERLPGETFPTVITVRVLPVNAFSSKMAIYSHKPVGSNSRETNQERTERWVSLLQERADR